MDHGQPFTNKQKKKCITLPRERLCFTSKSLIKNIPSPSDSLRTNHFKENEVKGKTILKI